MDKVIAQVGNQRCSKQCVSSCNPKHARASGPRLCKHSPGVLPQLRTQESPVWLPWVLWMNTLWCMKMLAVIDVSFCLLRGYLYLSVRCWVRREPHRALDECHLPHPESWPYSIAQSFTTDFCHRLSLIKSCHTVLDM